MGAWTLNVDDDGLVCGATRGEPIELLDGQRHVVVAALPDRRFGDVLRVDDADLVYVDDADVVRNGCVPSTCEDD